jgi:hypothetical protein
MEIAMALPNIRLRLTPELKQYLDHIEDGKKASVVRSSLDLYFNVGWVMYEIYHESRNAKYYGILETEHYLDSPTLLLELSKYDTSLGGILGAFPLSEFSVSIAGVFPKLDECVRYRDWVMNDWVNSGGHLYNEDSNFVRFICIGIDADSSLTLMQYCKRKKTTINKIFSKLLKKFLNHL